MPFASFLTIGAAYAQFNEEIRPLIPADDIPALSEAWNNYTDELTRDRNGLNSTQYQYCPAVDDDMPEDGVDTDIEFLLDAMGVTFKVKQIAARTDKVMDDMPAGSTFYSITFTRHGKRFSVQYSQGPGITTRPDMLDVLGSLFMDAGSADETFEDWCSNLGYSDDSRKALAVYKACGRIAKKLEKLFTSQEMSDLGDMLNDR